MPSLRQVYLNSVWNPYPEVPERSHSVGGWLKRYGSEVTPEFTQPLRIVGKLCQISFREKMLVLAQTEKKLTLVVNGPAKWEESSPQNCQEETWRDPFLVLVPGDVVMVEIHDWKWDPISGKHQEDMHELRGTSASAFFRLLAPSHHSLTSPSCGWEWLKRWEKFVRGVRDFFVEQGFWEMETPYLVTCPGLEPTLDPFLTELQLGKIKTKVHLPTSPEISLKKILSVGAHDLFEIKKCFRNGEWTPSHRPEFWMLEWYRAFSKLDGIRMDLIQLIGYLSERQLIPPTSLTPELVTMGELFKEFFDFHLQPSTTSKELKKLCQREKLSTGSIELWNDFFHLLFIEKIEPQLKTRGAVFISHFPPSQAALARLTVDGWADRCEFYWKGLEIANAFHELNDPVEQLRRNQQDIQERVQLGKESLAQDPEFIMALENGMPPASGMALGLERLFMAAWDLTSIENIRFSIP